MKKYIKIIIEYSWGPCLIFVSYYFLFHTELNFGARMFELCIFFVFYIFLTSLIRIKYITNTSRLIWNLFDLTMVVMVLIMMFALKYKTIGIISPSGEVSHSPSDALYFSIVTWTTLGFGDFQPLPNARYLAAIEAFLGYIITALYIGLFLNWLQQNTKNNA